MTRRHASLLALVLAVATASACDRTAPEPGAPRPTRDGRFVVGFRPAAEPPPLHEIHDWTVEVRRPDGRPVLGAAVSVDGGMPEHQHGLPTVPRMTRELGEGRYLVEGMKFSMGGHWVLEVTVSSEGAEDVARFERDLPQ